MRLCGWTAEDYAVMTDAELVHLMGWRGWSYDHALEGEVRDRGLF